MNHHRPHPNHHHHRHHHQFIAYVCKFQELVNIGKCQSVLFFNPAFIEFAYPRHCCNYSWYSLITQDYNSIDSFSSYKSKLCFF